MNWKNSMKCKNFEWREKKPSIKFKKFNEIQELNEGKKPSMKFENSMKCKNWMKGKTFLMKFKNFNEMQEFEGREKPFYWNSKIQWNAWIWLKGKTF